LTKNAERQETRVFRELAIQFAGQYFNISLDISLACSRWTTAEAVTHYSGRSAEPQNLRQTSGICKTFLREQRLKHYSLHSKRLNRKRRFSKHFLTASNRGSSMINHAIGSSGIRKPIPELFLAFRPGCIGHAGLLFPRLFCPVLPRPEISPALFHPDIRHISFVSNYLVVNALLAEYLIPTYFDAAIA
jgi:hypothetical protein